MARLDLFLLVADFECRDWLERQLNSVHTFGQR